MCFAGRLRTRSTLPWVVSNSRHHHRDPPASRGTATASSSSDLSPARTTRHMTATARLVSRPSVRARSSVRGHGGASGAVVGECGLWPVADHLSLRRATRSGQIGGSDDANVISSIMSKIRKVDHRSSLFRASGGVKVATAMICPLLVALSGSGVANANQSDVSAPSQEAPGLGKGDFVHISTSGGPRAASGHGWWIHPDPSLRADVTVQLQIQKGGTWVSVGPPGPPARLAPGDPGRGKRATGRANCTGTATMNWRSLIDVDVVDKIDSPGKTITETRPIPCSV